MAEPLAVAVSRAAAAGDSQRNSEPVNQRTDKRKFSLSSVVIMFIVKDYILILYDIHLINLHILLVRHLYPHRTDQSTNHPHVCSN